MKIDVKVIPNAKREFIKKEGNILKVYLTVARIEGKANKALIEALADYFHLRKSQIEITKGLQSRNKTIIINGNLPTDLNQ